MSEPMQGLAVSDVPDGRVADPRGVRVTLGPTSLHAGLAALVLEPPEVPLAPAPRVAGRGPLGGTAPVTAFEAVPSDEPRIVLANGIPVAASLQRFDDERAVVIRTTSAGTSRDPVLLLPAEAIPGGPTRGALRREVVVGGWRVEVEIEAASRAALRERARRGREEMAHSGPTEVHAIIPGVIVGVSVTSGDAVSAGQQLLVVEAMKMQNELRAPRDGSIERVAVVVGQTIEVGDLLLVIA
jgi:biotin carboxyl carrier protein